ncbi:LacI family DNA-binding transcriptional regulator [Eisenbergiella massiliensis]|uniref:LacI family transcriptional regulator n=1 Tax=Eisenbergiella massiliensis TaxID=1720294 RepID=A0A3E3I4R4_9FIRM|nr:LacI family DNA-binding transcriptional regulator [Eisenbergiella massiliensis]RGE60260.1 LacI family transcriptional regulator [Eisenbergiella massiliensis]
MNKPKKVSLQDIAHALDISTTAVSLTLRGRGTQSRISEKTQQLIFDKAKELGYSYNSKGNSISSFPYANGASILNPVSLPFISGKITIYFFGGTASEIESTGAINRFLFSALDYIHSLNLSIDFVLQSFELNKLQESAHLLSKKYCHGAILAGLSDTDLQYLNDTKFDIPIVLYGRSSVEHVCVSTDNYETGAIAARHLFMRNYKHVAYINISSYNKVYSLKKSGFIDTFMKLTGNEPLGCEVNLDDKVNYEATIKNLLSKFTLPVGLCCFYDFLLLDIFRCASDMNIKIPEDMELISDGDHILNTLLQPNVTSMRPPVEEMSKDCIDFILNMIFTGNTLPKGIEKSHVVNIIYRDSSPAPDLKVE